MQWQGFCSISKVSNAFAYSNLKIKNKHTGKYLFQLTKLVKELTVFQKIKTNMNWLLITVLRAIRITIFK